MKQELEGVLPEVQLLCQALLQRESIFAAKPGRRLKGVASAPELQVCSWHLQCPHQQQEPAKLMWLIDQVNGGKVRGMKRMWQTGILRVLSQALGENVLHKAYTLAASPPIEALLTRLIILRVIPGSCG